MCSADRASRQLRSGLTCSGSGPGSAGEGLFPRPLPPALPCPSSLWLFGLLGSIFREREAALPDRGAPPARGGQCPRWEGQNRPQPRRSRPAGGPGNRALPPARDTAPRASRGTAGPQPRCSGRLTGCLQPFGADPSRICPPASAREVGEHRAPGVGRRRWGNTCVGV